MQFYRNFCVTTRQPQSQPPVIALNNCLLNLTTEVTESKSEFLKISNTIEPFQITLHGVLQKLFQPTLNYADTKMKSFLLQDFKVQDSITGFQQLCFFLYGGITNSFCDRVLSLPTIKLKNRWKIQKCLIDAAGDGDLGLDLNLLEVELIESAAESPFNGFEFVYNVF